MRHLGSLLLTPIAALAAACATSSRVEEAPTADEMIVADVGGAPLAALPNGGEQLDYSIALAGLPVGRATLTTAREGSVLRIEATGETNAVIDLIYAVRGVARARLDDEGRSKSFYLWVAEDGNESERALAFDATPCLYYHPHDQEAWVASLTQYKTPRDPLGLLTLLRRIEPDGLPHDFEVAMTLHSFCYRARCLGVVDVDVGAGTFRGARQWRVEVRPYRELGVATEVGPMLGFYELVLSDDERRLPLRLTRAFGFGEVTLELSNCERIERPATGVATTLGE